jgi:ABC-type phosphate transport system substrate-binding protein
MSSQFKKLAIAVAAAAPFAASAATMYGGGATLPAIAYVGKSFFVAPPGTSNRLSSTPDAGSLFAADMSFYGLTGISYCQTGSGAGRKVLYGAAGFSADGTCPNFAGTPTGFAAPSGQTMPNFAASDAPIASAEYTSYLTNRGVVGTEPVQIPEVSGSIAVIYNINGYSAQATFSEASVCKMFAGIITDFADPALGLNIGPVGSHPITVVYRSDGSGTSFSMGNHLAAVCPGEGVSGFSAPVGSATFASAFPGGVPIAGAVGKSGNPGVVSYIASTTNTLGYGETGDALLEAAGPLSYAKIKLKDGINPATGKKYKGMDPVKNFKAVKLVKANVLADNVVNGNNVDGTPHVQSLTSLSITPPLAGCVQLVDPTAYSKAPLNATTGEYASYPIQAVSYLFANQTGNGANETAVEKILGGAYDTNVKALVTSIGSGTGFGYIAGIKPTAANGANKAIKDCVLP